MIRELVVGILVGLGLALVACGPVPQGDDEFDFDFSNITIPPTPRPTYRIVSVIDGDTLEIEIDGVTERVRLIGVDAPEVHGEIECFGHEASQEVKSRLLVGTYVSLEKDVLEWAPYRRLLRYVYLTDGRMLNELLVEEGYARAMFPPDVKHAELYEERFLIAQKKAQEERKGLWRFCSQGIHNDNPIGERTGLPLLYSPDGPDRDCGDFYYWFEAQDFYEAAGGPAVDPHRLDGDNDGVACESND